MLSGRLLSSIKSTSKNLISTKTGLFFSVALIASGIMAFVALWTRDPAALQQETIARQWNSAINQIGIDPVYPPQEDLMIGDIFLVTNDSSSDRYSPSEESSLGRKSLKLWRMDLGKELETIYAKSFTFPKTTQRVADGIIWEHEATQASIFNRDKTRKHMPVVVFPELTVATIRDASASSGFGFSGIGLAFGATGSSDHTTEIRIRGAESYAIPYLVAMGALNRFCSDRFFSIYCTDDGARRALSSVLGQSVYELVPDPNDDTRTVYRVGVEIMIISQVYLTRWIETVDHAGQSFGAKARVENNIEAALKEMEVVAAEEKKSISPSQNSRLSDDTKAALQTSIDRLRESLKQLDGNEFYNGIASSVNSRGVSVNETLPRPVAIGFQSVRRILTTNGAEEEN